MTKEELIKLYHELIIPESKDPFQFTSVENCAETIMAYNPFCGDKFELCLNKKRGALDLHFHGKGCGISKASTSVMIRQLQGMGEREAMSFCKKFLGVVEERDNFEKKTDEKLKILAEIRHFEGRMDCVVLSWEALYNYLKGE